MKATKKSNAISLEDKLPPAGLRVIVLGKDYRCLGYIDRDGIWRDDARQKELRDVIGWMEL